jgi:hypothetical protein
MTHIPATEVVLLLKSGGNEVWKRRSATADTNLQILKSSNPQILKSSNPQILKSSNPQILQSSNPPILASAALPADTLSQTQQRLLKTFL